MSKRPLTKRSICSDPNLSRQQRFTLLERMKTVSFPIQWTIKDGGNGTVVHIVYPGQPYDPRNVATEDLPPGYDGGGGSLAISEDIDKIRHHYIRGVNGIKIYYEGEKSPFAQTYRGREQINGCKQQALSGWILAYYGLATNHPVNRLVEEIIANVIIHAPSPTEEYYDTENLEAVNMSEFTKVYTGFVSLQDIVTDLQEMRASVGHNQWISVNLNFALAGKSVAVNEENIRTYAASLKISVNIKWE